MENGRPEIIERERERAEEADCAGKRLTCVVGRLLVWNLQRLEVAEMEKAVYGSRVIVVVVVVVVVKVASQNERVWQADEG